MDQDKPPQNEPQGGAADKKLPPGHKPMDPRDEFMCKALLDGKIGRALIRTLEPLARRDLNPQNLRVAFNPVLQAIDISVGLTDVNTPLWANLQAFLWNSRMAWRWDVEGPQLILVVRWFLPYAFDTVITPPVQPPDIPGQEPGEDPAGIPEGEGTLQPPEQVPTYPADDPPDPNQSQAIGVP